jgi:hypothetical protein
MNILVFYALGVLALAYVSYVSYGSGDLMASAFSFAGLFVGVWVTVEKARSMWLEREGPYL